MSRYIGNLILPTKILLQIETNYKKKTTYVMLFFIKYNCTNTIFFLSD